MSKKVLTVNVVIPDEKRGGEFRQFFAGDEFDTETEGHLLKLLGDHCFAPQETPEDEAPDLWDLKVPQLVAIAKELGVDAHSNKKKDLIDAIEAYQAE